MAQGTQRFLHCLECVNAPRRRGASGVSGKQFSCRKSAGNTRGLTLRHGNANEQHVQLPGPRRRRSHARRNLPSDLVRPIGKRTLEDVLTAMCGDVADIARADIVSIYVREDADEGVRFTMRGNVGFPAEAVGRVHLRPGEGITGFAAERMRPVSVAVGKRDAHFKYIPGLGEERYPGAAGGAHRPRRRDRPACWCCSGAWRVRSANGEVVLATALAAVINHALERGEERERQAARRAERRAVRLPRARDGRRIRDGARRGAADAVGAGPRAESGERPSAASLEATVERLQTDLRKARRQRHRGRRRSAAQPVADPRGLAFPRRAGRRLRRARAAQGAVRAGARPTRACAFTIAQRRSRRRGADRRPRRRDRRPVRVRLRRDARAAAR